MYTKHVYFVSIISSVALLSLKDRAGKVNKKFFVFLSFITIKFTILYNK